MKIFDVPIEPLEERYSSQWATWFAAEYATQKRRDATFSWERVLGRKLTTTIETGAFLDVHGTNYYKASQIQKLVKMLYTERIGSVERNHWILFHDLWFPGIESLAYVRDGTGNPRRFKIAGCLHAGSWDPHDYLSKRGMRGWASPFEQSMLEIANLIFVATEFHKNMLCNYHGQQWKEKIKVTGFPIHAQQPTKWAQPSGKTPGLVVFPHRMDPEKNPQWFDMLKHDLQGRGFTFVFSKLTCRTKQEYYQLLAQAEYAISFAFQETWGIAMQEALFLGCIPLVPQRLSYEEMYEGSLQYDSFQHLKKILVACQTYPEVKKTYIAAAVRTFARLQERGKAAITRMILEMYNAS